MKIKPAGFYVLIDMDVVEETSEGGIILNNDLVKKEQAACQFGVITAFGPAAFKGFPGCDGPEDWGVAVGDRVEYRRYEGMRSNHPDAENFRYIPDSHIIGVIKDDSDDEIKAAHKALLLGEGEIIFDGVTISQMDGQAKAFDHNYIPYVTYAWGDKQATSQELEGYLCRSILGAARLAACTKPEGEAVGNRPVSIVWRRKIGISDPDENGVMVISARCSIYTEEVTINQSE